MKEWFTARELADLELPGLPTNKRSFNRHAQSDGWENRLTPTGTPLFRKRTGHVGGGVEYHYSLLPADARAALTAREAKIDSLAQPDLPITLEPEPEITDEARVLRRDARLACLTMADQHHSKNRHLGRTACDHDFVMRWKKGEVEIAPWIKDELPRLSARSLGRWRRERDQGRWHAVGGSGRIVKPLIERLEQGRVAAKIVALMVHQPFLFASHVRDLVEAEFGAKLKSDGMIYDLPHERTFARFMANWKQKHNQTWLKLTNPDKWKSSSRISGSNAYGHIVEVNRLWEIDASPADVLCTDGRYSIYVLIDVFSRRMMALFTKTPRAAAALLLLRKAILAWGVPQELRTDNGADFLAQTFVRGLNALGITHDVTDPFSPQQKGIIERAIGTLQRGFMTLQPGFIGHSVADRKQIEGRKAFAARLGESDDKAFCVELTHTDLQSACDRWLDTKYANDVHGTLGTTPFLKAQESRATIRRVNNQRVLDLLLSPVQGGWRQVGKRGIRLDGDDYLAAGLMPGKRVFCRMDPEDMGRLFVFEDEHGAFIAEAVCAHRAGVDPAELVARARAAQSKMIKEETAAIRLEARRIKPRDMIDDVLRLAAEKAPNVTPFPKREEQHHSQALEHASNALEATFEAPVETPVAANDATPSPNIHQLPETSHQRFRRAMQCEAALARGEQIDPETLIWLGGYQTHSEYQSFKKINADFGTDWLDAYV